MLPAPLETTGDLSAPARIRVLVFSQMVFISIPSYYTQAVMCEFYPISIPLDNNSREPAAKRGRGTVFCHRPLTRVPALSLKPGLCPSSGGRVSQPAASSWGVGNRGEGQLKDSVKITLPRRAACRTFSARSGVNPGPPAMGEGSLNQRNPRKVSLCCLKKALGTTAWTCARE